MKQESNPLNPGFPSVIFAFVLIGLKVAGILSIPWWLALLPVYFWYAFAVAVPVFAVSALVGVLAVAIPIVGLALLFGPLIDKLGGRRSVRTLPPSGWDRHDEMLSNDMVEDLPAGVVEYGRLADLSGRLHGYIKVPGGKFWHGPFTLDGWAGKTVSPKYRDTRFAFAPSPQDESPTPNPDAGDHTQEA